MEIVKLFAFTFFCFFQSGQCGVTLHNLVVPDTSVASFATDLDAQTAVTLQKTPQIKPPANCKSARCLRIFYAGMLIGELALTDLKNNNIVHENGVLDVVEFVGYGEHGALGLVKAAVLAENGRTVIVVPMPRSDGSRGNYGHIQNGYRVDADYELIEEFLRTNYKGRVTIVPWIDAENSRELKNTRKGSLSQTLLQNNANAVKASDVEQWVIVQTAFRVKMVNAVLTGGEKLSCKCIGDSYFGSNLNAGGVHRLLATFSTIIGGEKHFGARVVSTKAPTGFTSEGFLKEWTLDAKLKNEAKTLIPHAILTATLNESLLVGLKTTAVLNDQIDEDSTKLPGTSILVANAEFEIALPFPDKDTVLAKLKPISDVEVNIKSSTPGATVNGLTYTLIQCEDDQRTFTVDKDKLRDAATVLAVGLYDKNAPNKWV